MIILHKRSNLKNRSVYIYNILSDYGRLLSPLSSMKKTNKSKLRLRAIREWSTQIVRPKKTPEKAFDDSGKIDNTDVSSTVRKETNQRLQDTVSASHPKRKLNLDRRAEKSDRRVNSDPSYKGPVRRYTIDRRINLNDRRSNS